MDKSRHLETSSHKMIFVFIHRDFESHLRPPNYIVHILRDLEIFPQLMILASIHKGLEVGLNLSPLCIRLRALSAFLLFSNSHLAATIHKSKNDNIINFCNIPLHFKGLFILIQRLQYLASCCEPATSEQRFC